MPLIFDPARAVAVVPVLAAATGAPHLRFATVHTDDVGSTRWAWWTTYNIAPGALLDAGWMAREIVKAGGRFDPLPTPRQLRGYAVLKDSKPAVVPPGIDLLRVNAGVVASWLVGRGTRQHVLMHADPTVDTWVAVHPGIGLCLGFDPTTIAEVETMDRDAIALTLTDGRRYLVRADGLHDRWAGPPRLGAVGNLAGLVLDVMLCSASAGAPPTAELLEADLSAGVDFGAFSAAYAEPVSAGRVYARVGDDEVHLGDVVQGELRRPGAAAPPDYKPQLPAVLTATLTTPVDIDAATCSALAAAMAADQDRDLQQSILRELRSNPWQADQDRDLRQSILRELRSLGRR